MINTNDKNMAQYFNLWCCCHSDLAHRESDKFIIVNDQLKNTQAKSNEVNQSSSSLLNSSVCLES